PAAILDILLATNITLSVIVLLTTVYVRTPLEFNIFPSMLLATTLGRLVLNVASTRLILTHGGHDKLLAAGGVIRAFGEFVAGDQLVVGVIIFVIGVMQEGMTSAAAAEIFTKLTIGDGLVSQVPAFLISIAAGLLVTRSTQKSDLPAEFMTQLFNNPRALAVASGFLGILVFTNLPKIPLLALGAGCGSLALMLTRQTRAQDRKKVDDAKAESNKPHEDRIEDFLAIDPMEIEIGAALVK